LRPSAPTTGNPDVVDERLAKAFGHPLRARIIFELNLRLMSAKQFIEKHPQYSSSHVYEQFGLLEDWKCIELVEERSGGARRGATEKFYCATVRCVFDQSTWERMPRSAKNNATGNSITTYIERLAEAVKAKTIDSRPDRILSWMNGSFDQQAWDEMITELTEVFVRFPDRISKAAGRLQKSGEEPIPITVALSCFESPPESEQ
jgi:hypothetical protein